MSISQAGSSRAQSGRSHLPSLVVFIVVVMGVGSVLGYLTAPGEWYAALEKPAFNPPNWVFGPVWTLLYLMIAVAGWRVWTVAPASGAMRAWGAQMVLNWLWSPVFFVFQSPWLALAIILGMLSSIAAFIALARRIDRPAAWLFAPYAAWVSFATLLNASIAFLN